MTNYIPYHSKKRERRGRLELSLLRIISDGGTQEHLDRAAEAVRQARMRELAARRAQLPSTQEFATQLSEIDQTAAAWSTMPLDEIVSFYTRRSSGT